MTEVRGRTTESAAPDAVVEDSRIEAVDRADRWWSLGPRQRSALISWAGFTFTFAAVRGLTYAIKKGVAPRGDLEVSGVHLHHYLWGIKLLAVAGGLAVHGNEKVRAHPLVAAAYGAGSALVIDESALLVHFEDVYWSKHGRASVALAMGLIGGTGASFLFVPLLRKRHRGAGGHV